MVHNKLKNIAAQERFTIRNSGPLHGGDINQVYYCETERATVVIKMNDRQRFPDLFAKEASGLEALRKADAFRVPAVISQGNHAGTAYLIIEYLEPAPITNWAAFGEQLAALHQVSHPRFGFPEWNYIGSLRQENDWKDNAAAFYIEQRLQPQLDLAEQRGFSFDQIDELFRRAEELIPDEPAALLHGDLWNGNYLHSTEGFALIDPAVAYGPREMDLALMQLFGGYPAEVFEAYQSNFPCLPGWKKRVSLFQLYYILVHVNLFGRTYVGRAEAVIKSLL